MSVIKLLNISDWIQVDGNSLLDLPAPPVAKQSRQVRLAVNAGRRTRISLMRPGCEAFHLWTGEGLETIEFYLKGEGRVSFQSAEPAYADADGVVHEEPVDCAVFTVDGKRIARDFSHEEKFTQMLRPRSQSEQYVRTMEIAMSAYDALIQRQQGEIASLKAKGTVNGKAQPKPAGNQPASAPVGGEPAAGADEGGGVDAGTSVTGVDGDAGNGPSKRPKGAGGSTVPPAA